MNILAKTIKQINAKMARQTNMRNTSTDPLPSLLLPGFFNFISPGVYYALQANVRTSLGSKNKYLNYYFPGFSQYH